MGKMDRNINNIGKLYSVLFIIKCLLQEYITDNYVVAIRPFESAFPIALFVSHN